MKRAVRLLKKEFKLKKISSFYETCPVGPAGPRKFWNAAAQIQSPLRPRDLLKKLRALETTLGRRRNPRNRFAPRTIDMDLLPQKGYRSQFFIMIPLAEIAAKKRDSKSGKEFGELAEKMVYPKDAIRKIT